VAGDATDACTAVACYAHRQHYSLRVFHHTRTVTVWTGQNRQRYASQAKDMVPTARGGGCRSLGRAAFPAHLAETSLLTYSNLAWTEHTARLSQNITPVCIVGLKFAGRRWHL